MRHTPMVYIFPQIEKQKFSNLFSNPFFICHFDWWSICPWARGLSTELIYMIHLFCKMSPPLKNVFCLLLLGWRPRVFFKQGMRQKKPSWGKFPSSYRLLTQGFFKLFSSITLLNLPPFGMLLLQSERDSVWLQNQELSKETSIEA